MYKLSYESPFGKICVEYDDIAVKRLTFDDECIGGEIGPLMNDIIIQLDEYFAGVRRKFELPLSLEGTDFQMKVWSALQDIPYGETRTYGQIAAAIDNPKAVRAVGMANNKNPIAIIVPCHRVIGANGKLTGYAGGIETKKALLNLESSKL